MKTLVVYFSAGGTTAKVAKELAKEIHADLFQIRPEKPYTDEDLNWKNPLSRCNREKFGKKDVPVSGRAGNFNQYELILLGFPIWYGGAPNVVNTFCKDYNWKGKKVAVFATSGGSGIGKTAEKLRPYLKDGTLQDAKLVGSGQEAAAWAKSL